MKHTKTGIAVLALSGLLASLLCACAQGTGQPDASVSSQEDFLAGKVVEWLAAENHTAFQAGDFWVTMEGGEADASQGFTARLTVWDPQDLSQPLQTMEQETDPFLFGKVQVVDANFDGYLDFGSMYAMGNQPIYYDFWLWDQEQGCFVQEPSLSQVSDPQFDPADQIVSGYARGGFAGAAGEHVFYQWIDGQLTLIRRVETSVETWIETGAEDTVVLTVEDRGSGELKEVFCQTYSLSDGSWWAPCQQWCDLTYAGT